MVHVIDASSHDRALEIANTDLKNFATKKPRLSFGNRNLCKNFEILLRGYLSKKKRRLTNEQPLTTSGLIDEKKRESNPKAGALDENYCRTSDCWTD